MSNSNDQTSQETGWRFHAPIPQETVAPEDENAKSSSRIETKSNSRSKSSAAASSESSTSRGGKPRYSRSMAQRIKALNDGDVARFQFGDACFMALKIGSELFIRPFGEDSEILVNGVPIKDMTRITFDDTLQIGSRLILLRAPRRPKRNGDTVAKLLEILKELPKDADEAELERQKRAGYRDPTRPPEAWGE